MTNRYTFSKRSADNLEGVHPKLINVLETALNLGVMDFTVISGVRTQEEQDKLYAQGRTEPGEIVTNTRRSNHLIQEPTGYGHAVDLAPYPTFFDDTYLFHKLGGLILATASLEGVNVRWGGNWKMKDLPHFEITL